MNLLLIEIIIRHVYYEYTKLIRRISKISKMKDLFYVVLLFNCRKTKIISIHLICFYSPTTITMKVKKI